MNSLCRSASVIDASACGLASAHERGANALLTERRAHADLLHRQLVTHSANQHEAGHHAVVLEHPQLLVGNGPRSLGTDDRIRTSELGMPRIDEQRVAGPLDGDEAREVSGGGRPDHASGPVVRHAGESDLQAAGRPAVDEDVGARHETGPGTGHKGDDVGDLFGGAESAEWVLSHNRLPEFAVL